MKEKTCCFTGHRYIPGKIRRKLKKKIREAVLLLIEKGVLYFWAGGALGFDTLAAEVVISLKRKYKDIKLIMVYPCKDQTRFWKKKDIRKYEYIKQKSDKVVYISDEYTRSCMHERNRHLINNSKYCVCFLTKDSGGTAYTVDYAIKKGTNVINLAFYNE